MTDVSEVLTGFIDLMMESVSTSEISVSFSQSTRRNISENGHLHTRRHQNLRSHMYVSFFLLPLHPPLLPTKPQYLLLVHASETNFTKNTNAVYFFWSFR
jgi:hypothetical protein